MAARPENAAQIIRAAFERIGFFEFANDAWTVQSTMPILFEKAGEILDIANREGIGFLVSVDGIQALFDDSMFRGEDFIGKRAYLSGVGWHAETDDMAFGFKTGFEVVGQFRHLQYLWNLEETDGNEAICDICIPIKTHWLPLGHSLLRDDMTFVDDFLLPPQPRTWLYKNRAEHRLFFVSNQVDQVIRDAFVARARASEVWFPVLDREVLHDDLFYKRILRKLEHAHGDIWIINSQGVIGPEIKSDDEELAVARDANGVIRILKRSKLPTRIHVHTREWFEGDGISDDGAEKEEETLDARFVGCLPADVCADAVKDVLGGVRDVANIVAFYASDPYVEDEPVFAESPEFSTVPETPLRDLPNWNL